MQHILDQSGFAGTGNTGYAHKPFQRNAHIDILQVVSARTLELEPSVWAPFGDWLGRRGARRRRCEYPLLAAQVLAGERVGAFFDRRGSAEEDDFAAALAGTRAH